MDRPVAMKSNLHSVLFETTTTRFWVANASIDGKPAAEQPYHAFQLRELLDASGRIHRRPSCRGSPVVRRPGRPAAAALVGSQRHPPEQDHFPANAAHRGSSGGASSCG